MSMKIVTYAVIALLVLALGAGAFFYFKVYSPLTEDYARIKAGLPELDRAKTELKKYKEKEIRESKEGAWISPAIDALSSGLGDEIKSGKVEVLAAGNKVIVNISEEALFLPGSYTFAQESPALRANLATLLKTDKIKGKDVSIGNMTRSVPARGKGRRKIPAKDARTLAGERSAVLVKDFEKNGVNQDALIASAYSARQPEIGFKIRDRKAVIIIENQPTAPNVAAKQEQNAVKTSATPSATQVKPIPIPIQQAQPKAQ